MAQCPSCGSEHPSGKRYCGDCGAAIDLTSAPTETSLKSDPPANSHPTPDQARFIPGTVLARRYRIVGLLGRGGMGEVYRADDLKLGQTVALKFLPAQADEARRTRLLNEVKITRQISHPNVCRVYDVGDVDGHTFLSMEFIDGEDLASLLRRIGRLPEDKAVEIARQLCAGLSAAHDQGVLHRDFKPANVMIDGRGHARITDFGLGALAGEVAGAEIRSGTPKYMAPEQLAGREVTVRSDVYALGLVLYELFTGKAPFEARTPEELQRLQDTSAPTTPSNHVAGLDPAIERAVLRCLERDPAKRPASALAVAAALPGGDPLAAAVAAGETPSPEMVADAGGEGSLHPALATGLLIAVLAGLVGSMMFAGRMSWFGAAPLERSKSALVDRARQMILDLGFDEEPADWAAGIWAPDLEQRERAREQATTREELVAALEGRPRLWNVWYRQSPRPLGPRNNEFNVSWSNPPLDLSGMINVSLDSDGKLMDFNRIVPQERGADPPPPFDDWARVFDLAGLDLDEFDEIEPEWVPHYYCEGQRSWEGSFPGQPEPSVTVVGCSFEGKLARFFFVYPWSRPWRMNPSVPDAGQRAGAIAGAVVLTLLLVGTAYLARRSLLLGRGDRRGAARIAVFLFVLFSAQWILETDHVAEMSSQIDMTLWALVLFTFLSVLTFGMYLALEPVVRRRWPQTLVSWSRLLAGRVRDPLVGTHVLIGACVGVAWYLLGALPTLLPGWIGAGPPDLLEFDSDVLEGAGRAMGDVVYIFGNSSIGAMLFLFFAVLFLVLLRKRWAAIVAATLLFSLGSLGADAFWVSFALDLLGYGLFMFCLIRVGLLAGMAAAVVEAVPRNFPLASDLSAWYAMPSWMGFAIVALVLVVAFRISLGGRSVLKVDLLDV